MKRSLKVLLSLCTWAVVTLSGFLFDFVYVNKALVIHVELGEAVSAVFVIGIPLPV